MNGSEVISRFWEIEPPPMSDITFSLFPNQPFYHQVMYNVFGYEEYTKEDFTYLITNLAWGRTHGFRY